MAWTRTGTISLTNGQVKVYGSGTPWVANGKTRPGDALLAPDGKVYEIGSIESNTELTLTDAYLGATASGQAYKIQHLGLLPAELAVGISDLQSKYLTTIAQLYEWETSEAALVPITNPATGVTVNVKPLKRFLSALGDGSMAGIFTDLVVSGSIAVGGQPSAWGNYTKSVEVGGYAAVFSDLAGNGLSGIMHNAYLDGTTYKYRLAGSAFAGGYSFSPGLGTHVWKTSEVGEAPNAASMIDRMTLDAFGSLSIGRTYPVPGSASYLTLASDGVSKYGLTVANKSSANTSFISFVNSDDTMIASISQAGSSVVYSTTSDEDLNNDLGICKSTDVILRTEVHDFGWKATGEIDRGVFAQKAYLVKPSAVLVGSDKVNEAGQKIRPWGVDYSKYVPDLIVTDQMQERRINDLEAKLEAALARIEALEAA